MGIYKGGKLTEVSKNESSLYGNAETVGVIYCGGVFDLSSKYTSQFVRTGELETYDRVSRGKYIPLPSDVYGNDPDHIFWQLEQILVSHTPNTSLFRYAQTQNKTYEVLSALNFKQILVANSSQYTMNVRLIAQMTSGGPIKENTPEVTISSATVNSRHSIDLVTGRRIDTDFTNRLRNFLLSNLETRGLKLKVVADVIGFSDEGEQNFSDIRDQFSVTTSYIKDKTLFSPKIKVSGDQFEFVQEETNVVSEGITSSELLESKGINELIVKEDEIIIDTQENVVREQLRVTTNKIRPLEGVWIPNEGVNTLAPRSYTDWIFVSKSELETNYDFSRRYRYQLDKNFHTEGVLQVISIENLSQNTDPIYTIKDTRNPETQVPDGNIDLSIDRKFSRIASEDPRDLFYEVSSNVLTVSLKKIPIVTEQIRGWIEDFEAALGDLNIWDEKYTYNVTVKEYTMHDVLLNTHTFSVAYDANHTVKLNLNSRTVKVTARGTMSYNPIS